MPSDIWQRIDDEIRRRRKSWPWFAEQLNFSEGRVGNWKRRGVPASAYADIAAVFGWSTDRLLGIEPAPRSDADLSPMALKIAHEFDKIRDEAAQLAAFAHVIGVIARASGAAAEPPPMRPDQPPSGMQLPET